MTQEPISQVTRSDKNLRLSSIRWNLVLVGCNIAWRAAVLATGLLVIARGIYTMINVDPHTPVMALVGYLGLLLGVVAVTPYVLTEREQRRR